jgi:hypothetical protein
MKAGEATETVAIITITQDHPGILSAFLAPYILQLAQCKKGCMVYISSLCKYSYPGLHAKVGIVFICWFMDLINR